MFLYFPEYGVVSAVMHGMSFLHDAGLPWWGAIAVASLGLRMAVIPFNNAAVCGLVWR